MNAKNSIKLVDVENAGKVKIDKKCSKCKKSICCNSINQKIPTPKSKEDFVSKLEMLFETTLEAVIEQRLVMMVALREQADLEALIDYQQKLATFLEQAKLAGFVRTELDSEMITGAMIDRIINQVQFAPWIKRNSGVDVLTDKDYQQRWCQSNINLFLYGFMHP